MRTHISLRDYVSDPAGLYDVLQAVQARALESIGYRMILLLGLMTVAMLAPGEASQVAWCLAAMAGLSCIIAVADHAVRGGLMDYLTLHDVIRPREDTAAEVAILLAHLLAPNHELGEAGGKEGD